MTSPCRIDQCSIQLIDSFNGPKCLLFAPKSLLGIFYDSHTLWGHKWFLLTLNSGQYWTNLPKLRQKAPSLLIAGAGLPASLPVWNFCYPESKMKKAFSNNRQGLLSQWNGTIFGPIRCLAEEYLRLIFEVVPYTLPLNF